MSDHSFFVNRRQEIELVLRQLTSSLPTQSILEFHGTPGIGKSSLLRMLQLEGQRIGVPCVLIDFADPRYTGPSAPMTIAEDIVQTLSDQATGVIDPLNWLTQSAARQPVLLMFDSTERASDEVLSWLEENLIDSLLSSTAKVILVFAGRRPLRWRRFDIRRRMTIVRLGPFSRAATREQLERLVVHYGELSQEIFQLTAGHPAVNKLVLDYLQTRYGDRLDGATLKDMLMYIDADLVQEVSERYLAGVPEEARHALEAVAVLRQFNVNSLRLMLSRSIPSTTDKSTAYYLDLIGQLVDTSLVEWSSAKRGYVLDPTIRRILNRNAYLHTPTRYVTMHQLAAELYENWIQDYPEDGFRYCVEILYHRTNVVYSESPSVKAEIAQTWVEELQEWFLALADQISQPRGIALEIRETLYRDTELNELIGPENFQRLSTAIDSLVQALADGKATRIASVLFPPALFTATSVDEIVGCNVTVEDFLSKLRSSDLTYERVRQSLELMRPIFSILGKAHRVESPRDKQAYYLDALETLRNARNATAITLSPLFRVRTIQLIELWERLILAASERIRHRAELRWHFVSHRRPFAPQTTVALSLRNVGQAPADNVTARLLQQKGYQVLSDQASLPLIASDAEAQVAFTLRPQAPQPTRLMVQVTFDDGERKGKTIEIAEQIEFFTRAPRKVKSLPRNPYIAGDPLKPGDPFFGREDVFQFVRTTLPTHHIVLYGQRRTGKTSLLYQFQERLTGRYLPVLINVQGMLEIKGLPTFFYRLAWGIYQALHRASIGFPRPRRAEFADDPGFVFREEFLPDVRQALGSRDLLLMFDEFEYLEMMAREARLDPGIFGYLRDLMMHVPGVRIIFTGTHQLEELGADYWSILFNLVRYQKVSFLPPESTRKLIQEPVREHLTYDELAVDMLLRATAGHPYFTQLLCHETVQPFVGKRVDYITSNDTAQAIAKVAQEGCVHLDYIWREATPAERAFLYGLNWVLRREGEADADAVWNYLDKNGLRYREDGVVESLLFKELVEKSGERCHFRIRLVQEWVDRTKGPGDIPRRK